MNINNAWVPDWEYADICNEDARIFHIGRAGFFTHELEVSNLTASEASINQLTDAVEAQCPFGKLLGVSGYGEGIVWKGNESLRRPEVLVQVQGRHTSSEP